MSIPRTSATSEPAPWLWRTLSSIRLTVFVLLILAAVAVIGTLVPQDQPPEFYLERYGSWGNFLLGAGLARIYFSPWFLATIGLLATNILVCLIKGLPQAVRRSLSPFTGQAALGLPERGRFSWPAKIDPGPKVTSILRREVGTPRREVLAGEEVYLVRKGRLRPLGPYLIHLALLFILAGALIGKFWGVEGQLILDAGEQAHTVRLGSQGDLTLPFEVRLEKFQVSYYEPGGPPSEFRSDLTFIKDGQTVAHAVCRVNEPFTFGGFTFYQSSYGSEPAGPVRLTVRQGEQQQSLELSVRQAAELSGGQAQIMPVRVDGNFQGYGPAVLLALQSGSGHPWAFWVLKDHPELGDQPGPYRFTAEAVPFRYYSVLQVKRDPGVWWVYLGFLLFLPGFYLAFFRPAQRWAVVLTPKPGGGTQGRLLGASPRHREEFAATRERLLAAFSGGKST